MAILDKKNILNNLSEVKNNKLDIGCGQKKKDTSYIGIDTLDFEGVDIVGDIFEVLAIIPANSIDNVYSSHFFEHIKEVDKLLKEIGRVLRPNGELKIIVPHFSNPYFYSDYTHKSFFGLYSFSYLADEELFKRKVPKYQIESCFYISKVYLKFKSPFSIRNKLYNAYGSIINLSYYLKEFYEENFSRLIYCYQIEFTLIKKKYKN
jgi:ubiquinone/menaquinone biosynthesis C-methylase UbiE